VFSCVFVRDRSQPIESRFVCDLPSKMALFRGADDGSRIHTPLFARTDFKPVLSKQLDDIQISITYRSDERLIFFLLADISLEQHVNQAVKARLNRNAQSRSPEMPLRQPILSPRSDPNLDGEKLPPRQSQHNSSRSCGKAFRGSLLQNSVSSFGFRDRITEPDERISIPAQKDSSLKPL
jgi:hypothetical protein